MNATATAMAVANMVNVKEETMDADGKEAGESEIAAITRPISGDPNLWAARGRLSMTKMTLMATRTTSTRTKFQEIAVNHGHGHDHDHGHGLVHGPRGHDLALLLVVGVMAGAVVAVACPDADGVVLTGTDAGAIREEAAEMPGKSFAVPLSGNRLVARKDLEEVFEAIQSQGLQISSPLPHLCGALWVSALRVV